MTAVSALHRTSEDIKATLVTVLRHTSVMQDTKEEINTPGSNKLKKIMDTQCTIGLSTILIAASGRILLTKSTQIGGF